jgi:hypothetical protein
MTAQEFFDKTDLEINRAVADGRRYFYLISIVLPCNITTFENYYKKYNPEIRQCRNCQPPKIDAILNL